MKAWAVIFCAFGLLGKEGAFGYFCARLSKSNATAASRDETNYLMKTKNESKNQLTRQKKQNLKKTETKKPKSTID